MERKTVIRPLVREVGSAPAPPEALEGAASLPHPILLESVGGTDAGGRYSFLSADPVRVLRQAPGASGDPFGEVESVLGRLPVEAVPDLPPFQGGLAGYLGYELHRFLEAPRGRLPVRDIRHPDLWMGLYDWTVAWDHATGRCWIFSTGLPERGSGAREGRAKRRMELAERLLQGERVHAAGGRERHGLPKREGGDAVPSFPVPGLPGAWSTFSREGYLQAVERVRSYIRSGDAFQVNIAQRLSFESSGAPVAVYRKLRRANPASCSAAIQVDDGSWILSASPERFLRIRGGIVETRPIKGTAARGRTEEEDAERARSLLASEKDRAENVMIVDLLRNDLSLACADHSVEVPELCVLESHPSVHHLVSTVRGRLREGAGAVDVLRGAFPGGSVTGAPKLRALEIIGELEPVQRGVYTGAIGYLGVGGAVDLSVVIRTLVLEDDRALLSVGGGITLDSDPEAEYQETLDKARGVLGALEGRAS